MSRHRVNVKPAGADEATAVGMMRLSGVVRTSKGYAVATALIKPDGTCDVTIGLSQAFPEHVALEHKRIAVNSTLKAQEGR